MGDAEKTDHLNFLDLLPEMIFEIDKELNIKFLNKSCESILGYNRTISPQDHLPIDRFFAPDDLSRIQESIHKNFNGINISGNKYKVLSKSNNEITLEIKKCHIKQNGSIDAVKCIAIKILDENLDHSFENILYKQVFEHFPIPYQSLDMDGKINTVNPEWVNRMGYSKEEVIGKNFKSFISQNNKDVYDCTYADYIKNGEIRNSQVSLTTKSGKKILVNYIGKVEYSDNGDFVRTHCVFNDITEKQKIEQTLIESEQRLRELNSTKDKFFSIIAHDLKNPFNDLMGFTQLLGMNIDKYDKTKIKQFVDIIHQSSKLAYNLLENLLNWSRSQTGTLKFQPENIWINELIGENIQLLESTARKKNIEIYSELDNDIYAFADKNMIRTVIRNLISNAIKYTYQGGHINIGSYCSGRMCIIRVSDNGMGIEKENIDKIFKLDEGFSTSGTEREKGTGLGLILCKEFIEKNKGNIWVDSKPNEGSTFTFSLPLPEPDFPESEIIFENPE